LWRWQYEKDPILLKPNILRIDGLPFSAQLWFQEVIKHIDVTDTIDLYSVFLFLKEVGTNDEFL